MERFEIIVELDGVDRESAEILRQICAEVVRALVRFRFVNKMLAAPEIQAKVSVR